MSNGSLKVKAKKISNIVLIILLILGILTSGFGVSVVAFASVYSEPERSVNAQTPSTENNTEKTETEYFDPNKEYIDVKNEAALKDDVVVLSDTQSDAFNSSIYDIEHTDSYYNQNAMTITLSGDKHPELDSIDDGDTIYLQGDENTPFGDDRIFKVENKWTSGKYTKFEVSEPYFEDVFEEVSVCTSDFLLKENFVDAYMVEGVTAYFGNITTSAPEAEESNLSGAPTAQTLSVSSSEKPEVKPLANEYSTKGNDLIIKLDFDVSKLLKKSDKDKDDDVTKSYGLKGEVGIKDLRANMVVESKGASISDLYVGASGEYFVDVDFYGKLEAEASEDADIRDRKFLTLEGLSEKALPFAIFEFKGSTPIKLTHKQFENKKESLVPSMFVMLYFDWEGKISVEVTGGFDASYGFNNGLSIVKNGEFKPRFEEFPYEKAKVDNSGDGFNWNFTVDIDAETDITLLGGSLVFYLGGINIGELAVFKFGTEAKAKTSFTISSQEGVKLLDKDDTECYIRLYVKIIDISAKFKADGKGWADFITFDADFAFTLFDITLFELGYRPDEFNKKNPISTMPVPNEFDSVMTLVCDVSGSMYDRLGTGDTTKLQAAKQAAKVITDTTEDWAESYNGAYGIGVIQFSDYAQVVANPHVDYKYIRDCIDIMADGGGTDIPEGFNVALDNLELTSAESKVIILMTDGNGGSYDSIRNCANRAKDNDIRVFTIGFGEDVKADILQEVADITDGEYRYASTDNLMGIMAGFIHAQQSANADVLTELESTVGEGETSEESRFDVTDENGDLVVTTAWPGSFLDTILIDPRGRVVDENYPNAVTDESKIPSTITVKNPIKGEWSVKVKGVETSYEQEPFYTIVAFKEIDSALTESTLTGLQNFAVYCIPIGLLVSIASASMLCTINSKNKKKESEQIEL
ncbi:MAG: VWA domain-containing protein [Ruminococcaceae bacterium]|nr:VWA domain-containing protein [Oscillospiraceae bacterium]